MRRILTVLLCALLLSAVGFAQSTMSDSAKGKSCCEQKQVAKKQAPKSCCDEAGKQTSKACAGEQASKACAGKSAAECSSKQVAKKDCQGCDPSATWMTAPPAECNKCETASR